MRASVIAAWPAMCRKYEGVTTWMYLDTKGLVTTGIGFLINTVEAAQALPWITKDRQPATPTQIKQEWTRVHNNQSWKKYNGLNALWRNSAQLSLPLEVVDAKLLETTKAFWEQVRNDIPKLEQAPADAQLAIMDESWQNGKYFLNAGTVWKGTRAAVLDENWAAAANHVPGTGDRAEARKRLFNNAWAVKKNGYNPETLWDTKTPKADSTPAPTPDPKPVDPPKEIDVKHSNKWDSDYVEFRGGNFPPQTVEKLKAIPTTVKVVQGGLSFAKASSNTHAGLGVGDLSVRGMTKDEVWKLGEELWEVGIIPCPRGFVKDSFQGKSVSNLNDGNEHLHFLDTDEYEHMHPEAQAQVREILKGGDGLLGNAHYTGPSIKFKDDWDNSQFNPKNIKDGKGVFYVQTATLLGLNQLREQRESKKQNDRISYVKQVKRWGRWNAVTSKGRFFAIQVGDEVYLAPDKVVVDVPA